MLSTPAARGGRATLVRHLFLVSLALIPGAPAFAQATCDFSDVPGAVWWGTRSQMTAREFASYVAPVYWFSPDEPLLARRTATGQRSRQLASGADIRIPEALPFEDAPDRPVVYFQVDEIVQQAGLEIAGWIEDPNDKAESIIDFRSVGAVKLGYFAYFSEEAGLGAHPHDLEASEFRVGIARSGGPYLADLTDAVCDELTYVIIVSSVYAKAHGIVWFWNIVDVDDQTRFPMHLFVEEGKHGLATDKNADGYFTPGYDVSRHVNDAWGVRDIISTGALFSGGYNSFMTKVRQDEHRVFPPLPADSPAREFLDGRGDYANPYVEYELRPLPPAELGAFDEHLHGFMLQKEVPDWPERHYASDLQGFLDWTYQGQIVKSLGVAFRADGDLGFSFVFPLFIVKNFEMQLGGGFLVHRMYLKDKQLRDFGWLIMYTPSASRWIDTYVAAGVEWDKYEIIPDPEPGMEPMEVTQVDTDFVWETGIKFRVNLSTSPLKFLGFLTDFWGLRAGIKNKGFFEIEKLSYVLEFGAGVW
ncbi:MAG: hypothetical protein R3195_02040 [Gemmatimonadota bacterium]|nr:hypothetical protein [Gemmatimonadota bacterium]